ncbi:MAG: hypothetical protein RTU63_00195 [Candidatus Thorarchaeota archaeon]
MNIEYEWKDVWLLASIAMSENCDDASSSRLNKARIELTLDLAKLKNINHVIDAGDYIDRSTFTVVELTTGIKKLLDGDFIKIENDYLKTTSKTNKFYDKEQGERKHVSIKTALGIFKKLLDVK